MDLKELDDKIKQNWAEMKAHMDSQQKEITDGGTWRAETKAVLDKYSAKLQEFEDLQREFREMKNAPQRAPFGTPEDARRGFSQTPSKDREAAERKDLFFKAMRVGVAELDDTERKTVRQFFAVKRGSDLDERQTTTVRLDPEGKALSLGDETAGGYLAPPEFIQDILKGVQLISPIRPLAQVRTTSRRSVQYPVRSGVFAAKWVAETGTRSETAGLTYALEEIPNHEMYADVLVSDQDLEDAVFNLEQEILDNCTEQFAKAEGSAFVNGSGIGQPEGILTNTSIVNDVQGTGGGSVLIAQGLINIWQNIKTVYAKNATWLMNRQTIGACRSLVDSQGRFLWEPGLADATPPNLLGSPYIEVPDMPSVGANNFPIIYGNIKRGYLIVDRINVVVRRLQEKYAESGQVAYLVRKRVGGQVVLPEAIRKLKISVS